MFTLDDLEAAEKVVRAALPPTPAIHWPLISSRLGATAIVKHENHNPTGAFKVRGGLTFVEELKKRQPGVKGLISATRGNHGQSLAFAGRRAGLRVDIYVPRGNSVEKNAAMRALGARLVEHGDDFQEAREEAMRIAESVGLEPVPAYHVDLVRGVATYALELFSEHSDLDVLYVPIGQGSGIVGCISAREALGLKTEIVGVQAKGAPAYALSFAAGRAVATNAADTLADGVATRVPDADALEHHRARGSSASCSSPTTKSPRRSASIGGTPTTSPRAPAPRRSLLLCRSANGSRARKSASCSPAATSTSNCSNAGSPRLARSLPENPT